MRFTLKQLEYFLAAADAGSITIAAARARISQPSISAAISSLEAEFGVNLFVRNPAQGIILTVAGQRLMREVRDIINRMGGLYVVANELSSVVQGPLSIGCLVTVAPVILPSLLEPFRSAHPAVQLAFADLDQAEIIRRLRLAQIDVALTYDMQLPKDIRFTTLANLRPHVVVARDHPLAQHEEVQISELAEFSYIMLDLPLSREYFLSVFEQGGVSPNITQVTKSPEVVRSLVANGYGATIQTMLPRCEIALDGHPLVSIPLTGNISPLALGMATLEQGASTASVRTFEQYCVDRFKGGVPGMRTPCDGGA
ncbi:LysR family transcriptional regulator [Hyphomicrobium sp. 99]|uniref:LysR family transcriptional regulator n=1 Tax=Hyphomicrobium sp. 99 TaxID=1163419 RepID=UPI0005F83E25|nr:LysR family transcriptional regulator [Hyphomicrobium sp. 99]